jgi:hypothetical protein
LQNVGRNLFCFWYYVYWYYTRKWNYRWHCWLS